ncbi:MAG TPA: hypothetical protein VFO60_09345 [Candidatus Dormibacteraeota bacterium]|nr:hypothetical protein [Candidatus Dormibacteraeota bacterium]
MDVRITRVQVATESIDALIAAFRESAVPALRELPGYAGHSLAVNHESGDSQAATFWASRDALDASEEAAGGIRTSTVQAGGGSVVTVDRFEIAMMERFAPPVTPSFLRVTRGVVDPGRVDELVDAMRGEALAIVRAIAGVRALVLGVDRSSGRFAITSVWDSAEAREASMAQIGPLRERILPAVGVDGLETLAYEVASVEFVGVGATA